MSDPIKEIISKTFFEDNKPKRGRPKMLKKKSAPTIKEIKKKKIEEKGEKIKKTREKNLNKSREKTPEKKTKQGTKKTQVSPSTIPPQKKKKKKKPQKEKKPQKKKKKKKKTKKKENGENNSDVLDTDDEDETEEDELPEVGEVTFKHCGESLITDAAFKRIEKKIDTGVPDAPQLKYEEGARQRFKKNVEYNTVGKKLICEWDVLRRGKRMVRAPDLLNKLF